MSPRGIGSRGAWPLIIRDQLSPRNEHLIGVQEALAVMPLQAPFPWLWVGSLDTKSVDDNGVLAPFTKRSSDCLESNCFASVCWLCAAKERCDYVGHRAESVSNVPTAPLAPIQSDAYCLMRCMLSRRLFSFQASWSSCGPLWLSDILSQDDILVSSNRVPGIPGTGRGGVGRRLDRHH